MHSNHPPFSQQPSDHSSRGRLCGGFLCQFRLRLAASVQGDARNSEIKQTPQGQKEQWRPPPRKPFMLPVGSPPPSHIPGSTASLATGQREGRARCHTSSQGRVGGEKTQEPVGQTARTGRLCLRPALLAVFCCSSWGSTALPGSSVVATQNGSLASRMGEGPQRAAKERAEGNLGLLPTRLSAFSPRLGVLGSHLLPP